MPKKRKANSQESKQDDGETAVQTRATTKRKIDSVDQSQKDKNSKKRKVQDSTTKTQTKEGDNGNLKGSIKKRVNQRAASSTSSSSESDWEEVAEHPAAFLDPSTTSDGAGTSKTIQITVNAPKTKKELDLEGEIRRAIKRFKKAFQENLHKSHLLGFIAHGRHLSSVCNDELSKAIAFSMVPVGYTGIGKDTKFGKDQLKRFVKWFRSGFATPNTDDGNELLPVDLNTELRHSLQNRMVCDFRMISMCLVTTIRALGFDARIVINVHPVSRKMENDSGDVEKGDKKTSGSPSQGLSSDKKKKAAKEKSTLSTPKSNGRKSGKMSATSILEQRNSKGKTRSSTRKMSSLQTDSSNGSDQDEPGVALTAEKDGRKCDYFVEVYLENIEEWICVDCVEGTVGNAESVAALLTSPIIYCLAFDKDLALRDVTSRYGKDFMSTQTRRLRIHKDWLTETFALFKSTKRMRNRLEDMQLEEKLSTQALPTTVAEFKSHPLYVLKKDLLKFEAIYPADTKPIGYFRNEPVYPRSAVHLLHSKDTWRKQALVVKENEEPYKIVKGRPKWDAATKTNVDNREVPVYGLWQTEPYKPKAAKDGIVPRNEYGNVELFKPSMLPPGTVHLELPGLLQVAKKLDIDCAPAMVGWDFHGRGSHPVLNGWVVCEEYKEVLVAAWNEEQVLAKQRERERRSKKAIQNWRRLMKALLVREKLRRKFKSSMGEHSAVHSVTELKATTLKQDESVTRKSSQEEGIEEASISQRNGLAWPQCRHEFTGNQDEEI